MPPVDVRPATADDALLVAALMLQFVRAAGAEVPPGYLDDVAATWLAERRERPAWIAECAGQHVGVLVARVTAGLPRPGGTPRTVLVDLLHETPGSDAAGALREALEHWATQRAATLVHAGPDRDPEVTA